MKEREMWVDAVKGLTIFLVVFHHVFGGMNTAVGFSDDVNAFYNLLSPVRMPLFFLVAGFFAYKSIHGNVKSFINNKVIYFLYFYILWSFISISTRAFLSQYTNNKINFFDFFGIFLHPTFTLWFLYSLCITFILLRLFRNVKPIIQLIASLAIASFVINMDLSTTYRLLNKTLPLIPFFIIGVYWSEKIRIWVKKANGLRFAWLFCLLFLLGYTAYIYNSIHEPILYYSIALLSSGLIMSLIYYFRNSLFFIILTKIGSKSLFIYLMHFLPAAALRVLILKLDLPLSLLFITLICTCVSVALCLIVYKLLKDFPFIKYVFQMPNVIKIK